MLILIYYEGRRNRRNIIRSTTVRHSTRLWASSIQPHPFRRYPPICSIFKVDVYQEVSVPKFCMYSLPPSLIPATRPVNSSLLGFAALTVDYLHKSWSFSLWNIVHSLFTSFSLGPNTQSKVGSFWKIRTPHQYKCFVINVNISKTVYVWRKFITKTVQCIGLHEYSLVYECTRYIQIHMKTDVINKTKGVVKILFNIVGK